MSNSKESLHLKIYDNRFELYQNEEFYVFEQGTQGKAAQQRYNKINDILSGGYLDEVYKSLHTTDFSAFSNTNRELIKKLVDGITSEEGRGLAGLSFLQITIKSITPEQSIRLHKGGSRKGSFSWVDGISMRTIDRRYITPFLRSYSLLNLNADGVFMTRSLAENYPYSRLYKAEIRGPRNDWMDVVDAIEFGNMDPYFALRYMMVLLANKSKLFEEKASKLCDLAESFPWKTFDRIKPAIQTFFNKTDYSARAFEIAIHSLFQALSEHGYLGELDLVPLSQMRSANKKHGNVGDIELKEHSNIIEAWDAKYGKSYLRDELEELRDKLLDHPEVQVAGFVVESSPDLRPEILKRMEEIEVETSTKVYIFTFDELISYQTSNLNYNQKNEIAFSWLQSMAKSFARKNLDIAPIDEPCDEWVKDFINCLTEQSKL